MAIPVVSIKFEGEKLYSPFSGQAVQDDGEWNESDDTFLFSFLGTPGLFGHVSSRLHEALGTKDEHDLEDMEPNEIAKKLAIDGAFMLEIDAGWNGINYYSFAPAVD